MIRKWLETLAWLLSTSDEAPREDTYGRRFTAYTPTAPSQKED